MEKLITFDKCSVKNGNYNKIRIGTHPCYKYVNVYKNTKTYLLFFRGQIKINNKTYTREFDSDKDAAKWVDLKLIEFGKNPVNILKKK